MKRIWIACITLLLVLRISISAGADSLLMSTLDLPDPTRGSVVSTIDLDLTELLPYDTVRTEYLNRLLQHIQFSLDFQQIGDEAWGQIGIHIDGSTVVHAAFKESADSHEVQLSTDPETTYRSEKESPLAILLGETIPSDQLMNLQDPLFWLDDGYRLSEKIETVLSEYLQRKKISAKITGMGVATTKATITVPKADAEKAMSLLIAECPEGALKQQLLTLSFPGKQTFTALRDDSGKLLKVSYTGQCGAGDDIRSVTLSWTMCRLESMEADNFSLKSPAKTGTNHHTITFTRTETIDGDKNASLQMSFKQEQVLSKKKTVSSLSVELSSSVSGDGRMLSGTCTVSLDPPGEDTDAESLTLTPSLRFTNGEIDGQIAFRRLTGKRLLAEGTVTLQAKQAHFFPWMKTGKTVDPELMFDEDLRLISQTIQKKLTQRIIRRLVLLPREDTVFLSQDMSDTDWQDIVNAALAAIQKEENP